MSNNPCVNRWWYYDSHRGYLARQNEAQSSLRREHRFKKPKRWTKFKHPTRRD